MSDESDFNEMFIGKIKSHNKKKKRNVYVCTKKILFLSVFNLNRISTECDNKYYKYSSRTTCFCLLNKWRGYYFQWHSLMIYGM